MPHTISSRLTGLIGHINTSARDQSLDIEKDTAQMSSIQVPDQLPWNPNNTRFPSQKDLPKLPGAPDGAAWVWGKDDQLGRLNLLTPQRVKASAAEIDTGEMVRLDLPLTVPETPAFDRQVFQHEIKTLVEGIAYDDTYVMNTQSGTQWDGFRHVGHIDSKCFYNGAKSTDFVGDAANTHDCSIHHLAIHGIAGRGILLDYYHYAKTHEKSYDPNTSHSISISELQACAASQGLDLRPESEGGDVRVGDLLLVRSGFVERYHELSSEQRHAAATRSHDDLCYAGLSREQAMRDWLHDCYFSAVAGDSPTFEVWPVPENDHLHQSLLALWGCPIGEMWDLDTLAKKCHARGKWTFFLTSAPANMPGGVGSHANATAIL